MPTTAADLPLVRRYPAFGDVPRAALCDLPTPVDRISLSGGRVLLLKRDDLSASPMGGNKARGLEWLLGPVRRGQRVITVGPRGSNHALATATYARALGARASVVRWDQHMNHAARAVDARLREVAHVTDARWVPVAYAVAALRRRGAHWIPAGGASPTAILGHVNGALELAAQIAQGACPRPTRVYVPLGTGGTAAGLALGFRIAGLQTPIVAVRVVPRLLGRGRRVAALANRTAALMERVTGQFMPRLSGHDIAVEHRHYAGGYGHPHPDAGPLREALSGARIGLDDTYSMKACAAAISSDDALPLLWLTFDDRALRPATTSTDPRPL